MINRRTPKPSCELQAIFLIRVKLVSRGQGLLFFFSHTEISHFFRGVNNILGINRQLWQLHFQTRLGFL